MDRLTGDWDRERTEQFLDEQTIPVRLATHTPRDGLWMLSLWYRYRDGHLECATGASAKVVDYLRENPGVAFEISTNDVPYRGVRGAGTADIAPDDDKAVLRDLIERYLGDTDSKLARSLLSPDRDEVRIRVDVDRAYTWDFSDRMGGE
ncbi:pyridoxamine 5'-phosphate oxidase family protein [Halosimplex litoreum]|uniref:Pyridoxamine 5'-phosphate oxidase family protein n=1 Tax=Halosimplex litoreum TaxID=1198301 RepID=A0A7T3FXF0_9EURY|nr:pyridoxamine 5'-phosphate oxidase family protein [Halosimplex litoreum]QPV62554.1 pyridoxamine 5'-phosphate oxidase family protein [Halosimplex litoreum]